MTAAPTRPSSESLELRFGYTNWEGRNSQRRVRPISVRYGQSKWHPRDGWLMLAIDLDKNEEREFSMRDMVMVERSDPIPLGVAQASAEPVAWQWQFPSKHLVWVPDPEDEGGTMGKPEIRWLWLCGFTKPGANYGEYRNLSPLSELSWTDFARCAACGREECIDLLDAKPEPRVHEYLGQGVVRAIWLWWRAAWHHRTGASAWDDPDGNTDWERLECIHCYGPGWDTNLSEIEVRERSIAPELMVLYNLYFHRVHA